MVCYAEQITKIDGFFGRVARKMNSQRLSRIGDGGPGDGKPRQRDQDGAWRVCRATRGPLHSDGEGGTSGEVRARSCRSPEEPGLYSNCSGHH